MHHHCIAIGIPVPHKDATAEEIRAEIQRRIWDSDALDGDCRKSDAPIPVPMDVLNTGGSHWTVSYLPNTVPGCNEFVLDIVRRVMTDYELSDWWQWGVILQPFGKKG